jgi:hypothetical protein
MPRDEGRIPLLSPEVAERIVTGVAAGNTVVEAAASGGVSRGTFLGWMARGRSERARLESDPDAEPAEREARYVDLLDRVEAARASAEVSAVAIVRRAMTGWDETTTIRTETQHLSADGEIVTLTTVQTKTLRRFSWNAAAWWLERSRPSKYGRFLRTDDAEADGEALDLDEMRDRARRLVKDELARKRARKVEATEPSGNGQVSGQDV